MTFSKYFMRVIVGSALVAACLSGCAGKVVREYDHQKKYYPPPKNELPKIYDSYHRLQAHKDGYVEYGSIVVKGSVDDARKEAAKRGADAVALKEKEIEEWMTTYNYSHSIYTGAQNRTDVYTPSSKEEISQGYEVWLHQYDPQNAPQRGLNGCFWPCTSFYPEGYEINYTCKKEDIQFFIDQGADIRKSPIAREALCYVRGQHSYGDQCSGLEVFQFIIDKGGLEFSSGIEEQFGDVEKYIDQTKKNIREGLDKQKKEYPNEKATPLNCSETYLQTDWFNQETGQTRKMFFRPLSVGEDIWFKEKILDIMDKKKK